MDVDAVIARRPQVAIVDELAHTNVPGARNGKRWQDVMLLLDEGINVISAVNVQHLESLNDVLERELGVTIRETVPDWVVGQADQVVNLDISAEDLRQRLREGKIYQADKIQTALANFFTDENLTTLRELALREVASSVDRSREEIVRRQEGGGVAAPRAAPSIASWRACRAIRRCRACCCARRSRIAGRLNSDWFCVYVQTPGERADRIDSTIQRHLVDNIQLAQSLGAEVVKLEGSDVAAALGRFAAERGVTLAIVGETRRSRWYRLRRGSIVERLMAPPRADSTCSSSRLPMKRRCEAHASGARVTGATNDGAAHRRATSRASVAWRLAAGVLPSVLAVGLRVGLFYYGKTGSRRAGDDSRSRHGADARRRSIVAWVNATYFAERLARLAARDRTGIRDRRADRRIRPHRAGGRHPGSALDARRRRSGRVRTPTAAARLHDQATMLAGVGERLHRAARSACGCRFRSCSRARSES